MVNKPFEGNKALGPSCLSNTDIVSTKPLPVRYGKVQGL